MRAEKRYIQKHVQERRHPKRLPTVADLQALWKRIEVQAKSTDGQIALIADDRERVEMLLVAEAIRIKQEKLALEIDAMLARAEREKNAPIGDFQRIGAVLPELRIPNCAKEGLTDV